MMWAALGMQDRECVATAKVCVECQYQRGNVAEHTMTDGREVQ